MDAENTIKRRRIVVTQSRNGCYTCKSRRIKCDETKPYCLRCERSKLSCAGYRDSPHSRADLADEGIDSATESSSSRASSENAPAFVLTCRPDSGQLGPRFAALACTALQSGEVSKFGRCNSMWAVSVPQLSYSVPVVALALASLGAAMEAKMYHQSASTSANMVAAKQYGLAIREIQKAVITKVQPCEPLLLSCLILACSDVIQWREINALTHVHGLLALLRSRWSSNPCSPFPTDNGSPEQQDEDEWTTVFTPKDDLDFLCVQVDLQIASFALGLPPHLPAINLTYMRNIPVNERTHSDLELEVVQAIHSCYRIANLMSEYKYQGLAAVPAALTLERARYISHVAVCLEKLQKHHKWNASSDRLLEEPDSFSRLALILRSQCLASFVYLSMISQGHECGYDSYASSFQRIVGDAETLLDSEPSGNEAFCSFTIGLGILQPLFFTAVKYRDPIYRRRAIALLQRGGREGPFQGPLLAALASRAVDVEESQLNTRRQSIAIAMDIPESARLHGVGMDVEARSAEKQMPITFSRCVNVDLMIEREGQWKAPEHWDIWTESLDLE